MIFFPNEIGELVFARANELELVSHKTLVLFWGVCGAKEEKQRFEKKVSETIVKKGYQVLDASHYFAKQEVFIEANLGI